MSDESAQNARLVLDISAGGSDCAAAETALCERFATRAWLYGRRHLGDDQRASDLAQTVMLSVLEAARSGRINQPEHLDRFVLGTCRNVALRMRSVDKAARSAETADVLALTFSPECDPVDLLKLHQCLASLQARARSVVVMSFSEGRSSQEISTELGTTEGNVRVLRHRALSQLRRCVSGEGEGENP